jgi:HAD superfamily hydrolase (TIGR01509 family)
VSEVAATKSVYNWPEEEKFLVPEAVKQHFRTQLASRGGKQCQKWRCQKWRSDFASYKNKYSKEAAEIEHILNGTLPEDWDGCCKDFPASEKGLPTRQSSSEVMNMVAQGVPWLLGGSGDLGSSCLTTLKVSGIEHFMPPESKLGDYGGRIFHFGIREHAMGAAMNGMALCNLRPFGSTFLAFSDYMKPPIRMSGMMQLGSIWIFTHDSLGVGEDGPTHQPTEQLIALRSIPGLLTFRPCDANEVLEMWKYSMPLKKQPVVFSLSRQPLPTLDRTKYGPASGLRKGAYKIAGNDCEPELILMSSGSEVSLMLQAHEHLDAQGVKVWSISVPCIELFMQQSKEYQNILLPPTCRARLSIEAATHHSWGFLTGLDGEHVGIESFGASAPIKCVQKEFGFTKEAVLAAAERVMDKNRTHKVSFCMETEHRSIMQDSTSEGESSDSDASSSEARTPEPSPLAKRISTPAILDKAALLLDIDGTLVLTDDIYFAVFTDLLAPYGYKVDKEFYIKNVHGKVDADVFKALMPSDYGPEELKAVSQKKDALFCAKAKELGVPIIPGLGEALAMAKQHGMRAVAVTNAPRPAGELCIEEIRKKFEAGDIIEDLVIGAECTRAKPFGDPYIEGMMRLGKKPEECIVFEDSRSGIAAGKAAGVAAIVGIRSSLDDAGLRAHGATASMADWQELTPEMLVNLLDGSTMSDSN